MTSPEHPASLDDPISMRVGRAWCEAQANYEIYEKLSPEALSTAINTGPGAGSLDAAAREWGRVATEMSSDVLQPFMRLLDVLLEAWSGSSAMQMHETTGPFHEWLIELEQQLNATTTLTQNIRTWYLAVSSVMVPLQEITDIRAKRDELATTNQLRQHTAAIARLDAEYEECRIVNAQAMTKYDTGVSVQLAQMTPWKSPPRITI